MIMSVEACLERKAMDTDEYSVSLLQRVLVSPFLSLFSDYASEAHRLFSSFILYNSTRASPIQCQ